MSQTSQLSGYRPAVLVATSIAAAYGIYYFYTSYSGSHVKIGGLHRSNAVHHPRGERRHNTGIDITFPGADFLLGTLRIRQGTRAFEHDLLRPQPPSRESISEAIGAVTDEFYTEIVHTVAVGMVQNYARLHADPGLRAQAASAGLDGLLHTPPSNIDPAIVQQELERLTRSQAFQAAEQASNSAIGEVAETEDLENDAEPVNGFKGLLYYIAEENSKRKAYVHRGISCGECGETPIRGIRYHCLNCPNFELCATCEASTGHVKLHVLAKVKIPLPLLSQPSTPLPLWYPGDPKMLRGSLDVTIKGDLARRYVLEEPSLDAFYDQFICTANVSCRVDLLGLDVAIDRNAFNQALTPVHWPQRQSPNAVYDRMFAYYDTNKDELIGFEEFLSGIMYIRGPRRFATMHRALEGFDMNSDGFLDRSDFLRLLRAKHILQQQLISDALGHNEGEQIMAAQDILRSRRPISSVFAQEDIPPSEQRPRRGKRLDEYGDMQPLPGVETIIGDDEPWPDATVRHTIGADPSSILHERLQQHISRWDDLLNEHADDEHTDDESVQQFERTFAVAAALPGGLHYNNTVAAVSDSQLNDALLRVVEEGLNQILDPMFAPVEGQDREAIETRTERFTWRDEIDAMLDEELQNERDLRLASEVDPLLATAFESYANRNAKHCTTEPLAFQPQILPTDAEGLAAREAQIAQQPLEDLLRAAGYNAVQGPQQAMIDRVSETDVNLSTQTTDHMMPRNGSSAGPVPASSLEPYPSNNHFRYLARLDAVDRRIAERGGPGRLSFDEIDGMVRADNSKQLQGLVTGWLELASF
ncbi:hypothetical protein LTR97_010418 [Elasticomyces elasticus]|uniref:Uncharacterized protein n=1 Tax=Elasticomyces elasticus TaxID=574655 RepID=A0AAN7ZRE5_9PEZI|nr:hypothetical protein LTR97_010418 [Elasticomyces elasticus]